MERISFEKAIELLFKGNEVYCQTQVSMAQYKIKENFDKTEVEISLNGTKIGSKRIEDFCFSFNQIINGVWTAKESPKKQNEGFSFKKEYRRMTNKMEQEYYTDEHGFKWRPVELVNGMKPPISICVDGCIYVKKGKRNDDKGGKRPCELSDKPEEHCFHLRPRHGERDYRRTKEDIAKVNKPQQRFEFSKKAVTGG